MAPALSSPLLPASTPPVSPIDALPSTAPAFLASAIAFAAARNRERCDDVTGAVTSVTGGRTVYDTTAGTGDGTGAGADADTGGLDRRGAVPEANPKLVSLADAISDVNASVSIGERPICAASSAALMGARERCACAAADDDVVDTPAHEPGASGLAGFWSAPTPRAAPPALIGDFTPARFAIMPPSCSATAYARVDETRGCWPPREDDAGKWGGCGDVGEVLSPGDSAASAAAAVVTIAVLTPETPLSGLPGLAARATSRR